MTVMRRVDSRFVRPIADDQTDDDSFRTSRRRSRAGACLRRASALVLAVLLICFGAFLPSFVCPGVASSTEPLGSTAGHVFAAICASFMQSRDCSCGSSTSDTEQLGAAHSSFAVPPPPPPEPQSAAASDVEPSGRRTKRPKTHTIVAGKNDGFQLSFWQGTGPQRDITYEAIVQPYTYTPHQLAGVVSAGLAGRFGEQVSCTLDDNGDFVVGPGRNTVPGTLVAMLSGGFGLLPANAVAGGGWAELGIELPPAQNRTVSVKSRWN
eukprot:TRINITY_DN6892_c0_g2_i1.p1 TRINITY_DN6892_c0_g2~~TRINITY_DN6892_c0_g2_i1.p1  ORF type:complete len:266 (-),score=45.73 TRINITY_DN6892_c0_g2_i1:39-836(-)